MKADEKIKGVVGEIGLERNEGSSISPWASS